MTAKQVLEEKKRQETRARLSNPWHITQNLFTEHQKIEGYTQDATLAEFEGCDRLLKMDSQYGTLQLGYDPKRGQSFLFANIKTSLFDTAADRYKRQLRENSMFRNLKSGNQNLSYSTRRRESSATLLYKMENKPWTEQSVAPYLGRQNLETLEKTMPFLNARTQLVQKQQAYAEKKQLEGKLRRAMQEKKYAEMAGLRAQETALARHQNTLSAIYERKSAQSISFFHKINMAFDLQKQRIFEYYRNRHKQRAAQALNASYLEDATGENDQNEE